MYFGIIFTTVSFICLIAFIIYYVIRSYRRTKQQRIDEWRDTEKYLRATYPSLFIETNYELHSKKHWYGIRNTVTNDFFVKGYNHPYVHINLPYELQSALTNIQQEYVSEYLLLVYKHLQQKQNDFLVEQAKLKTMVKYSKPITQDKNEF